MRVVVAEAAGKEVLVIPGDGGELRKGLERREHTLLAHRLVIVVLIGVSVAWIPVLQDSNSGQLFIYMQSVTSSLAPPVTALFVLGIFWPRANEQVGGEWGELGLQMGRRGQAPFSSRRQAVPSSCLPQHHPPSLSVCWGNPGLPRHHAPALPPLSQGAFWGLMVGLAVGTTRLVLEFLHPAPPCGDPDTRPAILGSIHYLHFAVALFLISGVVVVAGSLLTPPPHRAQVSLTPAPDRDP